MNFHHVQALHKFTTELYHRNETSRKNIINIIQESMQYFLKDLFQEGLPQT